MGVKVTWVCRWLARGMKARDDEDENGLGVWSRLSVEHLLRVSRNQSNVSFILWIEWPGSESCFQTGKLICIWDMNVSWLWWWKSSYLVEIDLIYFDKSWCCYCGMIKDSTISWYSILFYCFLAYLLFPIDLAWHVALFNLNL